MGFIEKAKDAIRDPKNREKARDLARKYNAKIDEGIDRLGREVDRRTSGKHRDKVHDAGQRAKDAVDDFAGPPGQETGPTDAPRRAYPDPDAPPPEAPPRRDV